MRIRNFTLEDFKKLYEEVKQDLISYGFPQIQEVKHTLSLNLRGRNTFGRCSKKGTHASQATIYLNKPYADSTTIERIKNTIMHELIHSIKGCEHHRGKWKDIAQMVTYKSNKKYEISRLTKTCPEFEDTIQKERHVSLKTNPYKYIVTCATCNKDFKYKTKGKIVKIVEQKSKRTIICPYCKGKNFTLRYL